MVTLKIYDILGREVRTLINEEKTRGNYRVSFNASALASGGFLQVNIRYLHINQKNGALK